jgi:hypothetical protein
MTYEVPIKCNYCGSQSVPFPQCAEDYLQRICCHITRFTTYGCDYANPGYYPLRQGTNPQGRSPGSAGVAVAV